MSELGDAIEDVRGELAGAAGEFMPDVCDLITSTSVPDGYGGSTETATTLVSDLPCSFKALGNPMQRQIGGGPVTTLTHMITLPSIVETKVIKSDYQIVVQAHDGFGVRTFENPVTLDGSLSPFIKVAAALAE